MSDHKGLSVLAVCDHDTVDGLPEAASVAAGLDTTLLLGIELSIDLHDGGTSHLLGYFPRSSPEVLRDPEGQLQKALRMVQEGRRERNRKILVRLSSLGVGLSPGSIERIESRPVLGRPHIAKAMFREGLVGSEKEAFDRYLARERPAYFERKRLTVDRAMDVIRSLEGFPVMAHPGLLGRSMTELRSLVGSLAEDGLAGLEVYYPTHSPDLQRSLLELCNEMGLMATGGTDYHGERMSSVPLGGDEDGFHVNAEDVAQFLAACALTLPREG
jgi:hypothetical protein